MVFVGGDLVKTYRSGWLLSVLKSSRKAVLQHFNSRPGRLDLLTQTHLRAASERKETNTRLDLSSRPLRSVVRSLCTIPISLE